MSGLRAGDVVWMDLTEATEITRERQIKAVERFRAWQASACFAPEDTSELTPALPWDEVTPELPPPTMCGCNRHEIPFGADPYAAHREFIAELEKGGK